MKILFGADPIRYPLTGIGRYALEVASRLPTTPGIENTLFYRNGAVLDHVPARPVAGNAERASVGLRRIAGKLPFVNRAYAAYTNFSQMRQLRQLDGYIFHGPNFYLPKYDGPSVSTFHDLSIFLWPQCHPANRVSHMSRELPLAVKRASVLITDSEFTRQEVAKYFNLSPSKIVVAQLAAAAEFRPMTVAQVQPVLAPLGLSHGSYSLFVGTLDPRKNIDLLIDVYERLPELLRQRFPLVVVGFEGWKSEKTIARLKDGERAGWARYLGFVEDRALPAMYAGARVFLYPSRYEGFGLPVLEAMSAGVPVICSDAASLPEVAGAEGAVLIADDDVDGFHQALLRAFEDDAWCIAACMNGVKQASRFSWERTVASTVQAYKLALQQ